MHKFRTFLKRLFSPVTIMLVPHTSTRPVTLKLPLASLIFAGVLCVIGAIFLVRIADSAFRYGPTLTELNYYKEKFAELESTIVSLDSASREFRKLFSLKDKEEVLDNMSETAEGSVDIEALQGQINKTIEEVGDIRDYLSEARDQYMSTPLGEPVAGELSSRFGYRIHPLKGTRDFHSGIDISAQPGTPVHATANGIVVYSGYIGGNGNLVIIEHGSGFRTFYAHNKKIIVRIGQVVKRGDVISYVGSTGTSTGPHVHYEVWKDGYTVDPTPFVKGEDWQKLAAMKPGR